MPQSKEQHRKYVADIRARKKAAQERAEFDRAFSSDTEWWNREPPLAKFMLDHMTPSEVDALLHRMETKPKRA